MPANSYIDKVKKVDQWLFRLRCSQANESCITLDHVGCYRNTIVLANYPYSEYESNNRPACLYLPFIKDGVNIKLTSCLYKR